MLTKFISQKNDYKQDRLGFHDIELSDILKDINNFKNIIVYTYKKLENNFRTYFIKKVFNKNKIIIMTAYKIFLVLEISVIYNRYLHKDNCSFELGGINIILNNNQLLFNTDIIFNGYVGYHFIFIAKSINKCYLLPNGLESINTPDNKCMLRFLWVHLGS
ncbi:hypothetical protein OGZ02_15640 [Brachyspira hyodysenteriae]|nr:hypothetical protein [Brachyspira hyodysenteriae]MDA1470214.1 hypothetical protein [Brachyspira hyodysenteriae]